MRVLLVEPEYRRIAPKVQRSEDANVNNRSSHKVADDEVLWYPPVGLMKLARYHKDRGDEVLFVRGCPKDIFSEGDLFSAGNLWDRVYITTLFTYHFNLVARTINFYRNAVGGTIGNIFVGGVMASLMPDAIYEETGIYPTIGTLTSSRQLGMNDDVNIDELPPDYGILSGRVYGINNTYYAYTTRGCTNACPWCGVHRIEPHYIPYIDIKPMIKKLRSERGDKTRLKLMDNNVLPSPYLNKIVEDLVSLGYGKDNQASGHPKRQRVVDFNQGLDATFINNDTMSLLSKLNVKPMRIAFDRIKEKRTYVKALELAREYGFTDFSNYMLYNFKDTPNDLYERMRVNIQLNQKWQRHSKTLRSARIYSYPMRYAPIDESDGKLANHSRESVNPIEVQRIDWLKTPVWTKRFARNIEIMKGAAHGAISSTPALASRTIGADFGEFISNLYMPEELLRNRNKHEKKIYEREPRRRRGSGKVEAFRRFLLDLAGEQNDRFLFFHKAVSENSTRAIRNALDACKEKEMKKWLKLYLKTQTKD